MMATLSLAEMIPALAVVAKNIRNVVCDYWLATYGTSSAWVAGFSQPTLLGINVGLTIEPLAQPTVTTQALCPV